MVMLDFAALRREIERSNRHLVFMVNHEGEIIDSVCYIKMGAKGADHRECTQTCADNGIPLALLEQDTENVIWLASSKSMQSPNADLRAHASHTVTVTGEWAERGGQKILVVEEIEHISR